MGQLINVNWLYIESMHKMRKTVISNGINLKFEEFKIEASFNPYPSTAFILLCSFCARISWEIWYGEFEDNRILSHIRLPPHLINGCHTDFNVDW